MIDAPGGTYWQAWKRYATRKLLGTGMISPQDMSLFTITDDANEAARVIMDFYRRYHSSRYVRDKLVLRLNEALSKRSLGRLNAKFGDILVKGKLRQIPEPLAEEEGELPDKVRLTLAFNRKDFGRLRQLIDKINAD